MDQLDLTGAVVIVTGASSGIGEATARALAAAGASPVLAGRRADRLRSLSAELQSALAVPTDVTEPEQVAELVAQTLACHGRIDGLVNNAGASLTGALADVDPQEFAARLQLNVVAIVRVTQAVLPTMLSQRRGRIVNISSGTTRMVPTGNGAYAATKAAVNMVTAVQRQELAGTGVVVGLVVPSVTGTEYGGGLYRVGDQPQPGLVVHRPEYVARVVLRALRTGEAEIDVPHGAEQPDLLRVPGQG